MQRLLKGEQTRLERCHPLLHQRWTRLFALAVIAVCGDSAAAETSSLTVDVVGLRNEAGVVHLSLFTSARGYPEESQLALRTKSAPTKAPKMTLTLTGLASGTYALAMLHDENENGRLDRNALGIPMEGIGASNDATRRWGAPRFEDARFELRKGQKTLRIEVHYWL